MNAASPMYELALPTSLSRSPFDSGGSNKSARPPDVARGGGGKRSKTLTETLSSCCRRVPRPPEEGGLRCGEEVLAVVRQGLRPGLRTSAKLSRMWTRSSDFSTGP
ncbi:hypothetical protein DIPPA_20924 [Diplonema papillatum]|nr:hypothetical protein DIPPA_20924 [Diplonema papillatum]